MDVLKKNAHSFIIRLWLEPREIKGASSFWRGMIEHVPTGKRRYFHRLDEIPKIIRSFLKVPGRDLDQHQSIWQRLKIIVTPRNKQNR